jgi:hypothetical protein
MVDYSGIGTGYDRPGIRKHLEELVRHHGKEGGLEKTLLGTIKQALPDIYKEYGDRIIVDEDSKVTGNSNTSILASFRDENRGGYILVSRKFAESINSLLSDYRIDSKFYGGIKMMFYHEVGHIIYGPRGFSEKLAQSYAMSASHNPEESLSAMIAILAYVRGESPESITHDGAMVWEIGSLERYLPLAKILHAYLDRIDPGR